MATVPYYHHDDLGYCPVKKYFEQYKSGKIEILANIDAKIKFLLENNGRPIPPIAKPLYGYSFFEIRSRKTADILIRIFYFCYGGKIVLLNALEKPSSYDTSKEKKKIEKILNLTAEYREKFILNPQTYEEYN